MVLSVVLKLDSRSPQSFVMEKSGKELLEYDSEIHLLCPMDETKPYRFRTS